MIKEMFFSNKTHEEVPESRFFAPDVNKIVEEVCRYYKVTRDDLMETIGNLIETYESQYITEIEGNPIDALNALMEEPWFQTVGSV